MELPDRVRAALILTYATLDVDEHQSLRDSYMHAMRAPFQSKATARRRANGFVRGHLLAAERLLCDCQPHWDQALYEFGTALHTVQDATSPAHAGFQTWFGFWNPIRAYLHVRKEGFDPGPDSGLDDATIWLWTFFVCKDQAPALPQDFFEGLSVDY